MAPPIITNLLSNMLELSELTVLLVVILVLLLVLVLLVLVVFVLTSLRGLERLGNCGGSNGYVVILRDYKKNNTNISKNYLHLGQSGLLHKIYRMRYVFDKNRTSWERFCMKIHKMLNIILNVGTKIG